MKPISESAGVRKLEKIREAFRDEIQSCYEHRAKPCSTCESPGICCRDEHFVNVQITRLEAEAIVRRLEKLEGEKRAEVAERVISAVEKYGLSDTEDTHSQTYACPLYEAAAGCLVHDSGKPLPCIAHACYERKKDLPPDELLAEKEFVIMQLNRRVYGTPVAAAPLPAAVARQLCRGKKLE